MSLDFSYAKVQPLPNGDDPTHHPFDEKRWHAVGDALVWASLVVGCDRLTDETIDMWERRLNIIQVDGPLLRVLIDGKTVDAYVTRADLEAFKGLTTNARFAPYETEAQWMKRYFKHLDLPYPSSQKPAYVLAHEAAEQAKAHREAQPIGSDRVPSDRATQRAEDGYPDA